MCDVKMSATTPRFSLLFTDLDRFPDRSPLPGSRHCADASEGSQQARADLRRQRHLVGEAVKVAPYLQEVPPYLQDAETVVWPRSTTGDIAAPIAQIHDAQVSKDTIPRFAYRVVKEIEAWISLPTKPN
jgi:hypothetical protein